MMGRPITSPALIVSCFVFFVFFVSSWFVSIRNP
jgi:hypothetical protein